MIEVQILVGNIGTGKSTHSKNLDNSWLIWNNDVVRRMFHPNEYVFDRKENEIILELRSHFICYSLRLGYNVCIDDTNIKIEYRKYMIDTIREWESGMGGVKIICVDFGSGDDYTLARRLGRRPRGISRERWTDTHKHLKETYEKPTLDEGFDEIIQGEII